MKSIPKWKKHLPLLVVGGTIPTLLILSYYFAWSKIIIIPLVVVLSIIFASMALWDFANRDTDGSEWWQDDSASGWRGY
jgi:hypothetical protein